MHGARSKTRPFGARFWALTPYYFVGMPFVLADPGVELAVVDDDPKAAGFEAADVVRVIFEANIGDAPDDYYVLYVAKTDGHLLGLRYVVSSRAVLKGKPFKHTPEKLTVYSDWLEVVGLRLAAKETFYDFSEGTKGRAVTHVSVSEVSADQPFDAARLRMPAGAVIDTAMD